MTEDQHRELAEFVREQAAEIGFRIIVAADLPKPRLPKPKSEEPAKAWAPEKIRPKPNAAGLNDLRNEIKRDFQIYLRSGGCGGQTYDE